MAQKLLSMVVNSLAHATLTPGSIDPQQLEELLTVFQIREARLVDSHGEEHLVPAPLCGFIRSLLDHLKRGEAVTVLPHDALLNTQQAAEILNLSTRFLDRLIEDNAVPVVMVGSRRRLSMHDVLQLREQRREVRRRALDELSNLGQELQVEGM